MKFLYPPRPEQAISPDLIHFYESKGWWAQLKKNGTLQVISISPNGKVTFKTRHNESNKAWQPSDELIGYFAHFKDSVLVGELLHSKHASVKNTIYLFDVLRLNGKNLFGMTTEERVDILHDQIPGYISAGGHVDHAQWYKKDLRYVFDTLDAPIDEGIVLKDPKAKLAPPLKEGVNSGWQVKVRKGHKNYGF